MKCKRFYKDQEKFRVYRNGYKRRYNSKRNFSDGKKRRWTEEEIEVVLAHEMTDTEIARMLGRSVSAVQVIRHRKSKEMDGWKK